MVDFALPEARRRRDMPAHGHCPALVELSSRIHRYSSFDYEHVFSCLLRRYVVFFFKYDTVTFTVLDAHLGWPNFILLQNTCVTFVFRIAHAEDSKEIQITIIRSHIL
jgi:hypothetical protein